MTRVIAISNQKGGVGKTTTCINLAASLSTLEQKVLLIDFDPQGNSSSGVGTFSDINQNNIYHALIQKIPVAEVIQPTMLENLQIIPTNINLSGAEIELVSTISRETKLRELINQIKTDFDYILIDCPPSLGLLTLNALIASDSVLIPLQCEYYAMEGLSQLVKTLKEVRKTLNPSLIIEGILPTMYDIRNNISKQVVYEVRQHFKNYVFETIIPRTVKLSEAPSFGKPALLYDPYNKGTIGYLDLAKELLKKHQNQEFNG